MENSGITNSGIEINCSSNGSFSKDLLNFQINRNIKSLGKSFLGILEENRDYILRLEKVLDTMGLEGFNKGNDEFCRFRKRILDQINQTDRFLRDFVDKVDGFNKI